MFPGGIPCATLAARERESANAVASGIQSAILALYADHVNADGKSVNYDALVSSSAFASYVNATAQLQFVDLDALTAQELRAFVLNVYNALVIHAIAVRGPADASVRTQLVLLSSLDCFV